MRRFLNAVVATSLSLAISFGSGCARKTVAKVSVFEPDGAPDALVQAAPRSGMYRVQFTSGDKFLKTPLYGSDRWVRKGEPLGFREEDDGSIVAIVGVQEVELTAMPAGATHLMWYHKSKRPTQLTKSMQAVLVAMGQIVVVSGVAAAYVSWLAVESYLGCDEDSSGTYSPPRHRKHRKHR